MSHQMQRVVFSGFGALAYLLCCVDIAQRQHEYAISGSVRSEEIDDSPIPQVRVELRTDTGTTVHPIVLTNDRGEFQFGQFPPGEYDVIAELEGYYAVRVRVDISHHDQLNLIIILRKVPTSAPTGDVTTAHQLGIPQKARDAFEKGVAKAHSKADYQGAIQEFQRAIKDYSDYYESYAEMGLAYVRLKDFELSRSAADASREANGAVVACWLR